MLSFLKREKSLKPVALAYDEEDRESLVDEYNELAKKLDVEVEVAVTSLGNVLASLMIPVYIQADVEAYMDKKGYWSWYPMRKKDRDAASVIRATPTQYNALYGSTQRTIYDQQIPYPVLLTAQTIIQKMGDDVLFFVAALTNHPDPFLGVMLKHDRSQFFIVERWDEPGFRSR